VSESYRFRSIGFDRNSEILIAYCNYKKTLQTNVKDQHEVLIKIVSSTVLPFHLPLVESMISSAICNNTIVVPCHVEA
jgi:hypothetical protein